MNVLVLIEYHLVVEEDWFWQVHQQTKELTTKL